MNDVEEMADARTMKEDVDTSTNMVWLNNRVLELEAEVKRLREELSRQYKWADNVREFFGDEAMMDLYDIYGGEE